MLSSFFITRKYYLWQPLFCVDLRTRFNRRLGFGHRNKLLRTPLAFKNEVSHDRGGFKVLDSPTPHQPLQAVGGRSETPSYAKMYLILPQQHDCVELVCLTILSRLKLRGGDIAMGHPVRWNVESMTERNSII